MTNKVVIDMLEDINAETEGVGFYYEHYVDYIKALPSVKPQESCDVPDINDGKMSENPTGSKDVIWYSKRNYSEIVVEPQESEDKCKNCEYYRNPDYTRCHECEAERSE